MCTEKLITDLSDEDRKVVEERLRFLQHLIASCEVYLQDYLGGKQDAFKFLNTTFYVHQEIEETVKLLMKLHDLPNFPNR
jgi:hypothetical protein